MMEEWRDIPGHPGYQASSFGRVRSKDRVCLKKDGTTANYKSKVLRPATNKGGYLAVALSNGKGRNERVHRLVALAFLGEPPEDKPYVLHNDGDKKNNTPANLRYGDASANAHDAIRHGQMLVGEERHTSKLTERQVRKILALRRSGMTQTEISESFGVAQSTVSNILTGKCWSHLAGEF